MSASSELLTAQQVVGLAGCADADVVDRALSLLALDGSLALAIDDGSVVLVDGAVSIPGQRQPGPLEPGVTRKIHRALADAYGQEGPIERRRARAVHAAASTLLPDDVVAEEVAEVAAALRSADRIDDAAQLWIAAARISSELAARAARLRAAGEALWLLSRFEDAGLVLLEAFAATDDPVVRADVAVILGQIELWVRGPRHALAVEVPTADAVAPIDPDRAAALYVHASHTVIVSMDAPAAIRFARRAMELAEAGSGALVPAAQVSLLMALVHAGERREADEVWAPLEDLAWLLIEAEGVPELEHLLNALGMVATLTERWPTAEAYLERVVFRARNAGSPSMLAMAAGCLAELRFRSGRFEQAMKLFEGEVEEGAAETGPVPRLWVESIAAHCAAVTDADTAATRTRAADCLVGAEALEATVAACWARAALALVDLAEGQPAAAARQLDPVAAAFRTFDVHEPGLLWWQADHVEALWRAGRRHEAVSALRRLEDDVEITGRRSAAGGAARCRALLAPDAETMEAAAAEAIDHFTELPSPLDAARSLLVRSERRLDMGRPGAAADVDEATTLLRDIGAMPWLDVARRVGEQVMRRGDPLAALTDAERRVAELAISGSRNRDIADALCLSPRTVESHLERIYRKLGVANRTQLAALTHQGSGS